MYVARVLRCAVLVAVVGSARATDARAQTGTISGSVVTNDSTSPGRAQLGCHPERSSVVILSAAKDLHHPDRGLSVGMMKILASLGMTHEPRLILLHGLGRTRWSLWPVAREAARRGYQVHNLGYPSRSTPIEELAENVGHRVLHLAGNATVDIVTHSMGGIVLRAAVAAGILPAETVRRVVMLAPPNHGSELADRLRDFRIYRLATGPAGQQIGANEHSVPRRLPPPPFEVGIIAGRRSTNPFFGRVLGAESDGKVTVESTRLEGLRDRVIVDRAHTFIMWAPDVLAHTFAFLEHGQFQR